MNKEETTEHSQRKAKKNTNKHISNKRRTMPRPIRGGGGSCIFEEVRPGMIKKSIQAPNTKDS